jgi:hypothetical protein
MDCSSVNHLMLVARVVGSLSKELGAAIKSLESHQQLIWHEGELLLDANVVERARRSSVEQAASAAGRAGALIFALSALNGVLEGAVDAEFCSRNYSENESKQHQAKAAS